MDRKYDLLSDHELMLAVRDSDAEAFAALFERHAKRLQWFFVVLSRDEHLADDLTQEAFLRVWRARESYEPSGTVEGYLFRIARNLWLNWKRDAARRPALDLAAGEHVLSVAAAEAAAQPEEVLLAKERRRRIEAALDELPEPLQIVFLLSHYQGMKYRDIAESLNMGALGQNCRNAPRSL